MVLPRNTSCSELSLGASGDADMEIMGTVAELGSFLKRTYFEAPGFFLTGHPGLFQMVVHLNLPFMATLVQRKLKDGMQSRWSLCCDTRAAKLSCPSSPEVYRV